jgi:hypothetical protein
MLTCNNLYQKIIFQITRTSECLKIKCKFVEQRYECYLANVSGAGTANISAELELFIPGF